MTWSTCIAIIGNGPSALSLSYVLSGHIPYYDPVVCGPHPDCVLHRQLLKYTEGSNVSLLDAISDTNIIDYIGQSFQSFFSETILPINLLLDALSASDETSFMNFESKECRIKWIYDRTRAVPHIVLGNNASAGGQWGNYEFDSKDELSLSYAEMLSLPGYSFSQYYKDRFQHDPIDFYRPPRYQVADYYSIYPSKVGIDQSVKSNVLVTYVDKASHDGSFVINMMENDTNSCKILTCQKIILATGIYESPLEMKKSSFSQRRLSFHELTNELIHGNGNGNGNDNNNLINKRHLSFTITPPLSTPPCEGAIVRKRTATTLVIGTGVSAAEAVNKSIEEGQECIHVYKWFDSKGSRCVLRRFPKELYPDYVKVFHMMEKRTVDNYEGLPNAQVLDISPDGVVEFKLEDVSNSIFRTVSCVKVCTGRTGSLGYLSDRILDEEVRTKRIGKKTLRELYMKDRDDGVSLKMADNVYGIGSLCGDTVVRFMLGSSVWVAGDIMRAI